MKIHAPATLRNREAIAKVLERELPATGTVLEIAAGSGEHAVYFAEHFPALDWWPSDPDPEAIASIAAYRDDYSGSNLIAPVLLDAAQDDWKPRLAHAIVCINMVHISAWEVTKGLFAGASQILSGKGSPLILYGPYFEQNVEAAQSNLDFDAGLKERNPHWGLRDIEEMDALAKRHDFIRRARHEMPANNLMLVYARA